MAPERRSARAAAAAASSSSAAPAANPAREVPCLGCLRSAWAGRSQGRCVFSGSGRSRRCSRCARGHQCTALPRSCHATALAYLDLLAAPGATKYAKTKARRASKAAVAAAKLRGEFGADFADEEEEEQENEEEEEQEPEQEQEEEEEDEDDDDEEREALKAKVKEGLCALVDLLF